MIDLYEECQGRFNECHDQSIPLPSSLGRGYFRSVCPRKGMLLFLEEYHLRREISLSTDAISLPLGFSYCVSGSVQWSIDGIQRSFNTRKGQCEMVLTDINKGRTTYNADEPVVIVNIMICPELLQSYFDAPLDLLERAAKSCPDRDVCDIFYRKDAIPGFINQTLLQLMRFPCRRMSDRLFIQGKVMELVAYQLERLDAPGMTAFEPNGSASDSAMISRAKAILENRMQSPPSLKRLARMVGTNETKLKKCFRNINGTTVFGYLNSCRMQRACELLEDEGMDMAGIADELGYAERTHFSRAFSRHFGIPPIQYRHKLRQIPS